MYVDKCTYHKKLFIVFFPNVIIICLDKKINSRLIKDKNIFYGYRHIVLGKDWCIWQWRSDWFYGCRKRI